MRAKYLADNNEDAEAINAYLRAIELGEKLPNFDKLEIARNLIALGRLYNREEHFAEAQPLFEKASQIRGQAFDVNAKEESKHVSLADLIEVSNEVAVCHQYQGNFDEAENAYRQLLSVQEQSRGKNDSGLLWTLINSGRCRFQLNKEVGTPGWTAPRPSS